MTLRKQLFAEAYATGATYKQISKSLGLSMTTLFNYRTELNLPSRKRGPRKQQ
jgi:hypothetical protein